MIHQSETILYDTSNSFDCYRRRYGTQGGLPGNLLQHGFFADFDCDAVEGGRYKPDFIPDILLDRDPVSSSAQVKPFNGDQKLFAEFSQ